MNTEYDVIIVGCGAAGLFAALSLDSHLNILMMSKDKIENSDSYLAQGGICTLKSPDDFDAFFQDTLNAGHGENNPESVKIMIENSPHIMKELMDYGVEFDLDKQGQLAYTREGAHSNYRILHHQDVTGKEITSKLIQQVKQRDNITLVEDMMMVDILHQDNRACGVVTYYQNQYLPLYSKNVILATGGMGGLFNHSTNFRHITGDAFAIALNNGIQLENLNYIQIHPTTLYTTKDERSFLISESVRGEGAYLLNKDGKRFTDELKPRDVVSNAIKEQMKKDQSDHVYLSVMHMDHQQILNRFPNIYKRCQEEGYDMFVQPVPVVPAQHYLMGGIQSDTYGRTSMACLYAVGETACNGVHGANRLASNSLLESLVFAKRAAKDIEKTIQDQEIIKDCLMKEYPSIEQLKKDYKEMVLNEIKKRDEEFYDKWC